MAASMSDFFQQRNGDGRRDGQHKVILLAPGKRDGTLVYWQNDFNRPEPGDKVFQVYKVEASMEKWRVPGKKWTKVAEDLHYKSGTRPRRAKVAV